jgi:hypothetical protein
MTRLAPLALFAALVTLAGCSKAPTPEPTQTPKYKEDPPAEKLEKAHLGCVYLDGVSLRYKVHDANPGKTDEEKLPPNANALHEPPFHKGSLLKDGRANLIDPWGKPYELTHVKRANGSTYVLIKTTAPDGTPITQFGVGKTEEPR